MLVRVDDVPAALTALAAAGLEARPTGPMVQVDVGPGEAAAVTRALAERGIYLTELRPLEVSLEDVFLQLTGEYGMGGDQRMPYPVAAGPPPSRPDLG